MYSELKVSHRSFLVTNLLYMYIFQERIQTLFFAGRGQRDNFFFLEGGGGPKHIFDHIVYHVKFPREGGPPSRSLTRTAHV